MSENQLRIATILGRYGALVDYETMLQAKNIKLNKAAHLELVKSIGNERRMYEMYIMVMSIALPVNLLIPSKVEMAVIIGGHFITQKLPHSKLGEELQKKIIEILEGNT